MFPSNISSVIENVIVPFTGYVVSKSNTNVNHSKNSDINSCDEVDNDLLSNTFSDLSLENNKNNNNNNKVIVESTFEINDYNAIDNSVEHYYQIQQQENDNSSSFDMIENHKIELPFQYDFSLFQKHIYNMRYNQLIGITPYMIASLTLLKIMNEGKIANKHIIKN